MQRSIFQTKALFAFFISLTLTGIIFAQVREKLSFITGFRGEINSRDFAKIEWPMHDTAKKELNKFLDL
jgi:hypothetical protein